MKKALAGLGLAKWMFASFLPLAPWLPYLIPYVREIARRVAEP